MPHTNHATPMIKHYLQVTKPGIIFGNIFTAAGGFAVAAHGHIDPFLLLTTLIAVSLVIASSCVFNNYIDRDIDALMERTKNRELVIGAIRPAAALLYAGMLGGTGFFLLWHYTTVLTVGVALAAVFAYVVLYSLIFKRTEWGTYVGSISGAAPPVIGYCAAGGQLDGGALLLFLILCLWQVPHFYAITMYLVDDYAKAKIPVLPITDGMRATKIHIVGYIIAFIGATILFTSLRYAGYLFLVVAVVLGLWWLQLAWSGFSATDDKKWAKSVFLRSLLVMMLAFGTMTLERVIF